MAGIPEATGLVCVTPIWPPREVLDITPEDRVLLQQRKVLFTFEVERAPTGHPGECPESSTIIEVIAKGPMAVKMSIEHMEIVQEYKETDRRTNNINEHAYMMRYYLARDTSGQ